MKNILEGQSEIKKSISQSRRLNCCYRWEDFENADIWRQSMSNAVEKSGEIVSLEARELGE